MASPAIVEKTTQQPAMEEPIEGTPLEPLQASGPTTVPERLVKKVAELSTCVLSTNPTKVDTLAPREPDQTEEQQLEVAQSTLADATARGKAMVVAETIDSRPAPPPLNRRLKRMK